MASQPASKTAHKRHSPIQVQPHHKQVPQHAAAAHPRSSTRLSTFSVTPTLAPSIAPSHLSASTSSLSEEKSSSMSSASSSGMARDMSALHATLARLDEPRLASQRYVPSDDKRDEIGALALGAKLEKALSRRMSSQDATFSKPKSKSASPATSPKKASKEGSSKALEAAAA